MAAVTRFAPSPTGYLHLGHARAALEVQATARRLGARALLRIEDNDHTRCRARFEDAIHEDLAWLGLGWDGPVRRQSDHVEAYRARLAALEARGLLYADARSRAERAGGAAPAPGARPALRLSLARACAALGPRAAGLGWRTLDGGWTRLDLSGVEDPVLARRDTGLSYHLCVTHDDAAQGVTHVVRGEDLADATPIHVLLQALLDLPTPIYRHHGLVMADAAGQKLSKRDGAAAIAALRAAGWSREAVIEAAGARALAEEIGL